MNRFSQFFASVKEKLFGKKQEAPKIERSTVSAPKPEQVTVKRVTIKHPLGIGHSMTRLKHIGGHPVRFLGREFKESFEKEYGVRLT